MTLRLPNLLVLLAAALGCCAAAQGQQYGGWGEEPQRQPMAPSAAPWPGGWNASPTPGGATFDSGYPSQQQPPANQAPPLGWGAQQAAPQPNDGQSGQYSVAQAQYTTPPPGYAAPTYGGQPNAFAPPPVNSTVVPNSTPTQFGPPPGYAPAPGYAPPPGYGPAPAPAGSVAAPLDPFIGVPPPGTPPPGAPNPFIAPPGGPSSYTGLEPYPGATPTDLEILLSEAQTGRLMFGVGVNSNAGVVGNIVIDERNFDWTRFPRSYEDFANGTAFRGAGQGFRLEAMPGTQVQRYVASFTEPYLFNTGVSMQLSAFYFTRNYFDWSEDRVGGRMQFGYRLTPDLTLAVAGRYENVDIYRPRVLIPELVSVLGNNDIAGAKISLTHDTRDNLFNPSEGHFAQLSFEQVFGSFDYPQGEVDLRRYFLLAERADGSGRHTLGFSNRVGVSGSQTPIFENYFAGGFSTLRGFDFRGASPRSGGVIVGGRFQFLGSVEYMFPVTADDMLKGVVFCDYGTVERDIEINAENFRVALGAGLRINVPALGPAPIALDFAAPLARADGDDTQVFSFFIGFNR